MWPENGGYQILHDLCHEIVRGAVLAQKLM